MKFVVAAVAAVGLLTACGGGSTPGASTGSSAASAGSPTTVVVKNFSFEPGSLSVKKGTKVTWKFEDSVQHNVTSTKKTFASKDIQSGSYSYTFNSAGKYGYYCSIHQTMQGTITVR